MQKIISKKDVLDFCNVSGDFNKIHIDEEYSKKTLFKECIVHGTFISGLIGKKIAEDFNSPILKFLNLQFINPVYVESEIEIVFNNINYLDNNILFDIIVYTKKYNITKIAIEGQSKISIKKIS